MDDDDEPEWINNAITTLTNTSSDQQPYLAAKCEATIRKTELILAELKSLHAALRNDVAIRSSQTNATRIEANARLKSSRR